MAAPAPPNANDHLFKGITFYITESVHQEVRAAVTDLLSTWGATPCPPFPSSSSSSPTSTSTSTHPRPPRFDLARVSHIITDTLDFPEYALVKDRLGSSGDAGGDGGVARASSSMASDGDAHRIEVVTPAWVTRSFDLQVLQPPRFYSADRALFFSGTVVCTSELPEADTLAIHSGVLALGGQTRRELTREVTHLIVAAEHGQKYEMALKFGTELGIVVVLPHWFEESLKLSTLVPIDLYRFPSPPFSTSLRAPTAPIVPFATRLHDFWRERLALSAPVAEGDLPATEPNTATSVILGRGRGAGPGRGAAGAAGPHDDETYLRGAGAAEGALPPPPPAAAAAVPAGAAAGAGRRARPFEGKRVYLASDLGLRPGLERALRARVRDAGGQCWSFAAGGGSGAGGVEGDGAREEEEEEEGGEGRERRDRRGSTADREDAWAKRRKAEKRLRGSDIVVLRTREGWEFWTAYDANLTIGNLPYLFHCLATSSLPSPLSRLLHYPLPSLHGLPAWHGQDIVMTVSNYAGPARDYVRALIEALGARFEGTMSKATSFVVSASEFGSKVQHARAWGLTLVTHCWLEALILEWRVVPPSAHPSYSLPPAGSAATHFTALLGDMAYSREGIERWAGAEEQREARRLATREVGELQREEEEALRRTVEREDDAAGEAPAGERARGDAVWDEEVRDSGPPEAPRGAADAVVAAEAPHAASPPPPAPLPKADRAPRARPSAESKEASPAPAPAPAAGPAPGATNKSAKPAAPVSKGKEREPLEPRRRSTTREPDADAMDVDEAEDDEDDEGAEAEDKPAARPTTPPKPSKKDKKEKKKKKKKEDKKDKAGASKVARAPSSPLSDPSGSESSSSSDDDTPPPSANAMGKTYALISDENLVVGGSKRGAAAKARAALVAQMGDRNAYEQELKSSGRKGGVAGRRSRSPRKPSAGAGATQDKEEGSDGDEEDEPEGMVKRGKKEASVDKGKAKGKGKRAVKTKREEDAEDQDDDDDALEDELSIDEPKKKKAKTSAPAHKVVKTVQASAGAATTQDGGVVSSFDKPPNAKPPAPVAAAKKVRIISTGLGLDKSSPEIKALKPFGATWTDRPPDATHLVVKGISRTEKFLCCLPYAPKIVDKRWIDACISAKRLVDETPFLLKDKKKEAEIDDTLEAILARARKGKLFGGRSVYVTRQVQPDCATMQRILQAAGAVVHVKDLSRTIKKIADEPDSLVVSTPADRREWEKLASAPYNRHVYSVEAVFASVLHMDLARGFTPDNRVDPRLHDD